ncbi:MAG: ankyrin repeat domain-containing protein, partial [Flavobacteriales bacterium]|nr:ankyrin repeat domain-containing protein [Flavobacteriales bacterium]
MMKKFFCISMLFLAFSSFAQTGDLAIQAIREGSLTKLKHEIDKGTPINMTNKDGKTLLIVACENSNRPIATYLLDNGADVNA